MCLIGQAELSTGDGMDRFDSWKDRLDRTELCHKGYVGQDRDIRIVPGRTGQETGMVCPIKNRLDRIGDWDGLSH